MPAAIKKARSWDLLLSGVGIAAALLTFVAFLYLAAHVNSTLERLQDENSIARVSSVLQALDQNTHHLADYTTGYAMWDDAYHFLDSRDPAFLETNFAPAVMAVSPIRLAAIYNLQGELLFSAALGEDAKPIPHPEALKDMPRLETFSSLHKTGDFSGRIEWIGDRAYLIAVCPITDSSGQSPIRGYLLFGVNIGPKMLTQIQNLTGTHVSVELPKVTTHFALQITTVDLGPASVAISHEDGSDDSIAVAIFRTENPQQHSVAIRILLPEHTLRTGRILAQSIRTTFVIVSLSFAAFFGLALREIYRRRADLQRRLLERDELQAARQRAESLAEKAEAADRAKSAFLAMISHEIRTPLNAIIGYADLLCHDPSQDLNDNLGIISRNSHILQRILDDILDYSKIEAGKLNILPRPTPIRRLIEEVIATFQNRADARGNVLISTIDPSVPEHLLLDDLRLRQIIGNLLSNAVKFTDHGTIHLSTSLLPPEDSSSPPAISTLRLSVEDEGIGIPPEDEHNLFEAFSQVDSTTRRRYGGTGLGLAICRRLCTLMGGDISYHRASPCGSVFVVTLPAPLATPSAEVRPPGPFSPTPQPDDLTVLIVDDNVINARLFQAILRRLGRTSHVAHSGPEAIDLFHSLSPDLIFMDIHMPGMDGLAATRAIRQAEAASSRPPCTIIAVTADILLADSAQSTAAGMNGHLNKPISVPQIAQTLTETSERKYKS
ncbi:hypothetical protein BH09VER1_BH09VER1_50940 [soil metagenome]